MAPDVDKIMEETLQEVITDGAKRAQFIRILLVLSLTNDRSVNNYKILLNDAIKNLEKEQVTKLIEAAEKLRPDLATQDKFKDATRDALNQNGFIRMSSGKIYTAGEAPDIQTEISGLSEEARMLKKAELNSEQTTQVFNPIQLLQLPTLQLRQISDILEQHLDTEKVPYTKQALGRFVFPKSYSKESLEKYEQIVYIMKANVEQGRPLDDGLKFKARPRPAVEHNLDPRDRASVDTIRERTQGLVQQDRSPTATPVASSQDQSRRR